MKQKIRSVIVSQNHYLNKIFDVHPLPNYSANNPFIHRCKKSRSKTISLKRLETSFNLKNKFEGILDITLIILSPILFPNGLFFLFLCYQNMKRPVTIFRDSLANPLNSLCLSENKG